MFGVSGLLVERQGELLAAGICSLVIYYILVWLKGAIFVTYIKPSHKRVPLFRLIVLLQPQCCGLRCAGPRCDLNT